MAQVKGVVKGVVKDIVKGKGKGKVNGKTPVLPPKITVPQPTAIYFIPYSKRMELLPGNRSTETYIARLFAGNANEQAARCRMYMDSDFVAEEGANIRSDFTDRRMRGVSKPRYAAPYDIIVRPGYVFSILNDIILRVLGLCSLEALYLDSECLAVAKLFASTFFSAFAFGCLPMAKHDDDVPIFEATLWGVGTGKIKPRVQHPDTVDVVKRASMGCFSSSE
jgi:hypothetical protein